MNLINKGTVKHDFKLKAGASKVYMRNSATKFDITVIKPVLSLDVTETATSMTVTGGGSIQNGDILWNPFTREKVYVTNNALGVLTVIRGVDGTRAQAMEANTVLVRREVGLQADAAFTINATTIGYVGTLNTDISGNIAKQLVLRRDRSSGSEEVMWLKDDLTGDIVVHRNYFLKRRNRLGNDIDTNDILIVCGEGCFDPEQYADPSRFGTGELVEWLELGLTDSSFMFERSAIETMDNLAQGDIFDSEGKYKFNITISRTDAEILSNFMQNYDLMIGKSDLEDYDEQGFALDFYEGEKILPVWLFVTGQEEITQNQVHVNLPAASILSGLEMAFAKDQRNVSLELSATYSDVFQANGKFLNRVII